jgi:TetR/AcrR family transcriptional regulator
MANSKPRARRRDPDRTREAILGAAQREFAAKGLSGGRVDAIARRARANKRMIYHYFGNKDGLYLAALERVYEDLRGTERTLDLGHLAPAAAIRRLVEFTFDYSRRHPELISLRRGVAQGVFRRGLDPVDLYITIAAVGYFYLSNNRTLSAIFGRDLGSAAACRRRKQHNIDVILHAIRA